ncbi:MAG: C4-type zinc ribbon domain-containing protein [Planctomycetota bacterium]
MNTLIYQTLQGLKELQEIDCHIFELEKVRQEKPSMLNSKKEQLAKTKAQIEISKEEIKKAKLEISKKDLDLKSLEANMAKMEMQLNMVKTNKEYSILQGEINGLKADRSLIEDKMLEMMGQAETIQKKSAEYEKEVSQMEKDIAALNEEINKEIIEINKKLEDVCQGRQKKCTGMEKEIVNNYERIVKHKPDRIALVKVVHNICQGCNMDITPQQLNDLKKGKQMVYCRSCMRMLYIAPEDQKS